MVGGEVDDNGNCAEDGPFPDQPARYLDAIGKDDASYHYFPLPPKKGDDVTGNELLLTYLLLTTYYLLLTTYYLLLTTYYLLHTTYYLLLTA